MVSWSLGLFTLTAHAEGNKCIVAFFPDGRVEVRDFYSRHKIAEYSVEKIETEYPDGTFEKKYYSRNTKSYDEQMETIYPDGSVTVKHPDGLVKTTDPNRGIWLSRSGSLNK